MEVTKWLKPSISVSRIGDGASVQAVTRVNAWQAPKRTMRRPTRQPFRGRLIRLGEAERRVRPAAAPGSGDSMYTLAQFAVSSQMSQDDLARVTRAFALIDVVPQIGEDANHLGPPVCTENLIRVDDVVESLKLAK
jgi:hypothetical protein